MSRQFGLPKPITATSSSTWRERTDSLRILITCGSWRAAHNFAFPFIKDIRDSLSASPLAYEFLGLYLMSCARLDHVDHIEAAIRWIQNIRRAHVTVTKEGNLLLGYHLARWHADRGHYDTAIRSLPGLRPVMHDFPWTRAHIYCLTARLSARRAVVDDALAYALHACRLAGRLDNPSLQADCYVSLANTLALKSDFEGAQKVLARAARSYWRAGDSTSRALCLVNQASQLLHLGRVSQAETVLKEALQLSVEIGRPRSALCARIALGWSAAYKGDLRSARELLLSSWRESRLRRAPREEALALEYLIDAYLQAGDKEELLRHARIVLRTMERIVSRLGVLGDLALECSLRKAKLLLASRDYRACLGEIDAALALSRQLEMSLERALALRLRATALYYLGQVSDATVVFRESYALFDSLGECLETRLILAWLDHLGETKGTNHVFRETCSTWLSSYILHPVFGPPSQSNAVMHSISSGVGLARSQMSAPKVNQQSYWQATGVLSKASRVRQLISLAETYAPENIPVLLLGETGTGKDLLARGIHDLSGRRGHYVPVNCAAAQKHLFAAELFGARKGAYTGASENREGLIREADKGTLFFDEIADLDAEAQGFLLRFLDSGEVRPLGSTKWTHVDVRIVAATCRDLKRLVAESRFRPDLYARLAAVVLRVPPLRERKEDLVPLLGMFWKRLGGSEEEYGTLFTRDMLDHLKQYPWPGNVRALRHLVALAIPLLRSQGPVKTRLHLIQWADQECLVRNGEVDYTESGAIAQPSYIGLTSDDNGTLSARIPSEKLNAQVSRWPVELLLNTLRAANGRVPDAARVLGVSRSQAYRIYKSVRALTQES